MECLPGEATSPTSTSSSGFASPFLLSYASVPGTSPCRGAESTLSTRVIGMGRSPGVLFARERVLIDGLREPERKSTSGTASAACFACATVPGTSPCAGLSSTRSTTVIGIGCPPSEEGAISGVCGSPSTAI